MKMSELRNNTAPELVSEKWLELSKAVNDFFESPVGEYILAKVELKIEELMGAILKADPKDFYRVSELQIKIEILKSIDDWLFSAIKVGEYIESDNYE
jgi:hypothetical protein